MDLDFFRQVLAEAAPLCDEIQLHLMGEPLGHPDFPAMVQVAGEYQTRLHITTNGLLCHGARAEALLHPIVRQVNFSVHSFSANFADKSPEAYMQRLFNFARAASERRRDLFINYRLWDLDATGTGANASVRDLISAEYDVDLASLAIDIRRRKGYLLRGRIYAHFDSRFDWPDPNGPFLSKQGTCHGLGTHFGIHADGTVVPCCLDKEAVIALGRIGDEPLENILQSPRARAMREGFARGQLVEDLCQRCPYIARFRRKAARLSQTAVNAERATIPR